MINVNLQSMLKNQFSSFFFHGWFVAVLKLLRAAIQIYSNEIP